MDYNHLCLGCFREKNAEQKICPYCSFNEEAYNKKAVEKMCLPAGTVLQGKYLIGKTLGAGGFGITYLAFQLNLDRMVAIKEFFPSNIAVRSEQTGSSRYEFNLKLTGIASRESFVKSLRSFEKEGKNLASINLPGVVGIHDFFRENSTAYLVMEFINGKNLKIYQKEHGGKLEEKELLTLLEPVIKSLEAIHEIGIIHRDISPDNLLLNAKGRLVLVDFGAARSVAGMQEGGEKSLTVVLKQGYAPLEQYSSHGNQGPWTDVYALCATMFRLLTGRTPDEASVRIQRENNDQEIREELMQAGVSRQTADAVAAGMKVLYSGRTQNMKELWEQLYEEEEDEQSVKMLSDMIGIGAFLLQRINELQERGDQEKPEKRSIKEGWSKKLREKNAARKPSPDRSAEDASAAQVPAGRDTPAPGSAARVPAAPGHAGRDTPAPGFAAQVPAASAVENKTGPVDAEPGSTVFFGSYVQDAGSTRGKKEIEWIVLARVDNAALLISRYALACQPYNDSLEDISWEKCSLRKWLNGSFKKAAFSPAEAERILETTVPDEKNKRFKTNAGRVTQDKIFLLSISEAEKYFSDNDLRKCAPTESAVSGGAQRSANEKTETGLPSCRWWLRSPGYKSNFAANIAYNGSVNYSGNLVYTDFDCVRPALWLNLGN